MKILLAVAVVPFAVGALVTGCASSGTAGHAASPASSAPPITAQAPVCAYLTAAEVHEFGDNVSYPGKPGHQDYGPTCDYGGAVFTLVDAGVSDKAFTYGATKKLSGLGDHAYYNSEWHWLRVASKRTRFELKCILCRDPELDAMTTVARSLVPRLPG